MSPRMPGDEAVSLLLECLHDGPDKISAGRLAALDGATWQALLTTARSHQLSTLLAHRLRTMGTQPIVPSPVWDALQADHRRIAVKNLAMFGELRVLTTELAAKGIPVIVLKGAHLAGCVYANLALREFVDLDLLVPAGDLERAAHVMEALGYTPDFPYVVADAISKRHQLPVFGRPGAANVELHWNIVRPNVRHSIDPTELWLRAQPVRIGPARALGLCPEDLLLHLCAHTSYHHRFDLGVRPAVDIAEVTRRFGAALSWPQLSELVHRWGWERGVHAALRLATELAGAAVPDDVLRDLRPATADEHGIETARRQMLGNRHASQLMRANVLAWWQERESTPRIKRLWRVVFVPKAQVAEHYALPVGSRRVYLYYVVRLRDILVRNWRLVLALSRGHAALTPIAERKADLAGWLSGEDEA